MTRSGSQRTTCTIRAKRELGGDTYVNIWIVREANDTANDNTEGGLNIDTADDLCEEESVIWVSTDKLFSSSESELSNMDINAEDANNYDKEQGIV